MLVLIRNAGTSFTIGDNITVTLVEVRGQQVRIGIDAPKDVPILRDNARNTRPNPSRARVPEPA